MTETFRIRRSQLEALGLDSRRRARAEWLDSLRARGLKVDDDPTTGQTTVEDKAGGKSFLEEIPGGLSVTCGERGPAGEKRAYAFRYTATGQVGEMTDPGGLRVVFDYDDHKRLSAVHRGSYGRFTFIYDSADNVIGIRYPDGSLSRMNHDGAGRLIETIDRTGQSRTFEYGAGGMVNRIVGFKGETTSCEYGLLGELIAAVSPLKTRQTYEDDPATGAVILRRTEAGATGAQEVVRISADLQAEKRTFAYPDGSFATFQYSKGQLVSATDGKCTVKMKYGAEGFLDEEETIVKGEPAPRVVKYTRNALGFLTAIDPPSGDRIEYGRDSEHRLRKVSRKKNSVWEIDYESSGALSTIRYPNGVVVTRACNAFGYPETQTLTSSGRPTGHDLHWTYDPCDRVATETSAEGSFKYTYDFEGRLLRVEDAVSGALHESWTLDVNGNPEVLNGRTCSFDDGDQMVRCGAETFRYDAQSNMAEGVCPQGRVKCEYNLGGQLVRTTVDAVVTEYFYDPFGRRIRKKGPDYVTHFFWAGQWLLAEVEEKAGKTNRRDYVVAADFGIPLAQQANGWLHHIHYGRRMEPLAMTDGAGDTIWRASWDAFGAAHIDKKWRVSLAIRLQGQYFDAETGYHYNIARYYDPALGRFLQRDPLGYEGGSWNEYIYCGGDPLNRTDPTGAFFWIAAGIVAGGLIMGGIEAYKEYKSGKGLHLGPILKETAIGMAVGALVSLGGLAVAGEAAALGLGVGMLVPEGMAVGTAATIATAAEGAVAGAVAVCANALFHGAEVTPDEIVKGGIIGAGAAVVLSAAFGVVGGLLARRALGAEAELDANAAVRTSAAIKSASTFKPQGVTAEEADSYLTTTAEGRAYLKSVADSDASGASDQEILDRASQQIMSGQTVPAQKQITRPLLKIVPKGEKVSDYTPFFTTKEGLDAAVQSGRPLSDVFGLPLNSTVESYDVYSITPKAGATAYECIVAPTSELGGTVTTSGKAVQMLVPDRGQFSAPQDEPISSIVNMGGN